MSTIYLTGVPGTGKTTITNEICKSNNDFLVLHYSEMLKNYLSEKHQTEYSISQLRKSSSTVVSEKDILELDESVLEIINESSSKHVILESHAITMEAFGYRATPFSMEQVLLLKPDIIIVLYADPEIIQKRIKQSPQGRKISTANDIDYSQQLQSALALQYGLLVGAKMLFINAAEDIDTIVKTIIQQVDKTGS